MSISFLTNGLKSISSTLHSFTHPFSSVWPFIARRRAAQSFWQFSPNLGHIKRCRSRGSGGQTSVSDWLNSVPRAAICRQGGNGFSRVSFSPAFAFRCVFSGLGSGELGVWVGRHAADSWLHLKFSLSLWGAIFRSMCTDRQPVRWRQERQEAFLYSTSYLNSHTKSLMSVGQGGFASPGTGGLLSLTAPRDSIYLEHNESLIYDNEQLRHPDYITHNSTGDRRR